MKKNNGLPDRKYHVALSFAGKDRAYVERVAQRLAAEGVSVFYDKFEEATLWGKDLYTHLRDVYENKALFTVMFISEHYRTKLWTNHERESAQSRAFEDNREYCASQYEDDPADYPRYEITENYCPKDLLYLDLNNDRSFQIQLRPCRG